MNAYLRGPPLILGEGMGYHILVTFYPKTSKDVLEIISFVDMLWIFLTLLIGSFESVSGAEQQTLCTSNACFTLHMNGVSFEMARQGCEHNGGYLMTVKNREEEHVLHLLLSKIQRQQHQDMVLKFWIGLRLRKGDCVVASNTLRGFKWTSGEEYSHYSNWGEEPGRTCMRESCATVLYTLSGENQLKWSAGACKIPTFYVCKFYFKGMCKPLVLLGPGQTTYRAPFSVEPQSNEMQLFPLGTYADILCSDQQPHYSVCMGTDNIYRWNVPGPFCKAGKQNCTINNGGCEHLCQQDTGEVQCFCATGYRLDEDGLTCRILDVCKVDTCEYQCVMGESGYSCKCPDGFELEANQRNCSDIDECQTQTCDHHLCINTHGSYTCLCRGGYKMVDGKCSDIDECEQLRCEHGCSNSVGSFSCYCKQGFTLSEDGHSCVDVNECTSNSCQSECVNTEGSFLCTCPQGFHVGTDGSTCSPDRTEASPAWSDGGTEEETQENFTESLTRTTVELQHRPPHTDAPLPDMVNNMASEQQSNTSMAESLTEVVKSRVLICVLGSVIPLLFLVGVTLAIAVFRCSRSKKEEKKNATADGYCWVSPGLDPRLEKLYDSILTDDP